MTILDIIVLITLLLIVITVLWTIARNGELPWENWYKELHNYKK